MSPDDERHGTTRGHAAGCRETCCREARNFDERRRRKQRQVLGIQRRIDGTGTRRRIQALWAIGWTSRDIATACGWSTPQAVTEVVGVRTHVFTTTAATIRQAYDDLSNTYGPSEKNRRMAATKGWATPNAWLCVDIDNPAAMPDPGWRDGRRKPQGETVEDFDWLVRQGEAPEQAAARVGVELDTITLYRKRLAAESDAA